MGMDGGWGVPCTHVHTHTHACTHTHTCMHGKHGNFMQMAAPLDLGKSQGFPMMSYVHVCVCMCMHVHVGGVHPLTTPHPPPPGGDPRNHSKFNST